MKSANIFFGRSYGYARAIIALLCGLTLVIWPGAIKNSIIVIIGTLILAVGIISLIFALTKNNGKPIEKAPLLMLNAVVDIAFGVILIIFRTFFADLIMFVFGIVLLIFGLGQIISLVRTDRKVSVNWGLYVGPALTALVGMFLFFYPGKSGDFAFRLFGISILIYSVSEFISTYIIRKGMQEEDSRRAEEPADAAEETGKDDFIKDIPYEEVGKK